MGKSYTEYSFMRHGGNELVYNADMVPADAIPPMEAKRDEITSGAFEVPIDPAEPS
ncbi:hypothetical protein [Rubellimicrobium mesophilum]|uniref:hypothetical protein n=1 Tax=Rubellimicrobium mesophilum TaxID=1123067 RepID=UPI001FE11C38|nr:hypothetical protein [Rubellimicrobium mesophilum]